MFHCLDHVRRFWTGLVRHDKHDMQKVDYITVKALELKAPGTSTSDSMTLYRQLKRGEIFSAFNLDRRMEIWAKLQAWEGLIPTLWTFFEDFKYIQACAHWVKRLVKVPPRGTLYTAMARSFSEMNQKRGKCIIQEAETAFTFRSSTTQDRVALHYRQVFLYIMRHLRELSPGSTKLEPKPSERKIRTTKDLDRSVLYGLADLAERLGFKSEKISDLKAEYSSHADGRLPSGQSKPAYVVDGRGECQERRCACPFDLAYEQSKDFLFLETMNETDKSQGSSIQSVFVRKSVYLAYFGRRVSYSEPESNDQNRENGNQEQEQDPSRKGTDQTYVPQEQPNAAETRKDRDISEWQDYAEQLGDTSHMFESPPRSHSVQGNQEPQPMDDVVELVTYDGEREQGSVAPSIISSSFYSDEIPLEDGPLEERVPFEESPIRPIASAPMEATEKDETLQERFKFIFRDGDEWITMEEYVFGPSLSSSVELTAEKHAREGRYLFDTALWSLHPSDCFEAAMANGTHVVLLFPAGRICISQQLAASASQLGDNARSFKDHARKRIANHDISTEDQARKKQII